MVWTMIFSCKFYKKLGQLCLRCTYARLHHWLILMQLILDAPSVVWFSPFRDHPRFGVHFQGRIHCLKHFCWVGQLGSEVGSLCQVVVEAPWPCVIPRWRTMTRTPVTDDTGGSLRVEVFVPRYVWRRWSSQKEGEGPFWIFLEG